MNLIIIFNINSNIKWIKTKTNKPERKTKIMYPAGVWGYKPKKRIHNKSVYSTYAGHTLQKFSAQVWH